MTKRGLLKKTLAMQKWEPLKAEIQERYHKQNWSQRELAKHFSVSQTAMSKVLKRLGLKSMGRGRAGELNGRFIDGSQATGYRHLVKKDKCAKCSATELLVVHHRNGDHQDNRLDNLQVLCGPCHNSHHRTIWWKNRRSSQSELNP